MNDKSSPYYLYDPESLGWLHRRVDENGDVLNADVVRIIEANTELVPDQILRDHIVLGLENGLKAKRGRKRKPSRMLKELYIVATYESLLPQMQARCKRQRNGKQKPRGSLGPAEVLYELIGKRFGMEPESVRNLISSHNRRAK